MICNLLCLLNFEERHCQSNYCFSVTRNTTVKMNHNILCVVYNWRILCMLPKIHQHACGKPTCQALQEVSRSRPHQGKVSAFTTVHVFVGSLSFWYITIIPNSHIIFHKRWIISCESFVTNERRYFMPCCQQEDIITWS